LAYDPYLTAAQIAERGAQKVELDELMRRSDFISVHCPRTTESFGMLGKAQFELMKPSAFFVTTARGGIHKEDDLYQVMKARRRRPRRVPGRTTVSGSSVAYAR
jgi:D-3-phosphoglycerate dehydrogenase / 2-oxoglutarate reductase